ncbi:hypothetical protein CRI94_09505 [Longibacter salinarum]|uniref:YhaN AAA domain-containing protein n=1 Tax=Longibacter salinarum TaxID=1850348 RepID=A0A2A8CYR6_9BACT|nr:AAA family ATPase [Longibacter salinarum]PEN13538.1 hypothetical protein CRI94_09505 [Longibacter salinarum]
MRIHSCHIEAFGRFRKLTLESLDHPVVVIHGDNEAGKTSFFHFLRSMLYGIYPTNADKHPYCPRSGRALEGEMMIQLDGEEPATISRRLRSSPQGTMVRGSETVDLRNRTIPAAQHVPQSVFESVYALQLDDLIRLEGAAWDEVQDRLLGSLSVEHIRSARPVIEELEDEASDLWRPDNRGKPTAKQLGKQRRQLREKARDARERDRHIRSLSAEVGTLESEIRALKEEKVSLTAQQNRAERLAPVRRLLNKIDVLEEEAGDLTPYASIPDDPRELIETLDTQRSEVELTLSEKSEQMEALERALDAPTDNDKQVLEHASQIRGWTKRIEVLQNRQVQAQEAERKAEEARRQLEAAGGILDRGWDDQYAEFIRQLSLADLRERIRGYERAAQDLREARSTAETLDVQAGAGAPIAIWVAVATFGAIMGVLTAWFTMPIAGLPAVGAVIAVVGIWQAILAHQENEDRAAQREALELERKEAEAETRAASVANLVAEVPVPSARVERPGPDLVDDLRMVKDALQTYDERRDAADRTRAAVEQAVTKVRALAAVCGMSETAANGEMPDVVGELETRLEDAEERSEAAQDAEERLPDVRETVSDLEARYQRLEGRITEVKTLLREIAESANDEDLPETAEEQIGRGIDALARRRSARGRAEMARDTLHSEYPDWEDRRDEIEALDDAEGWTFTDEERARMSQRLEEISAGLQEKTVEREGARKDLEHLLEKPTVAEIESELASVEQQLDEAKRERDRLMLLANIVRRADADFRRKHQPDVIRRASSIVSTVTRGRYERLELQDDGQRLVTFAENGTHPVTVAPPLSQGTLDQIYLAIRLAIVDHLDDGRDTLPLFLDEVFVNWDQERRRGAFDVLAEMAERRQLFFFTCHPYFAREVATHLDAALVDLDAVGGTPETRSSEPSAPSAAA